MKGLRTFWGLALALTLVLCGLSAPRFAAAQGGEDTPDLSRDWNVRVGLYIFNSEAARKASSDVGISGIVERTVYRTDKYEVNIGIGYNGFDRVYDVPVMGYLIAHPNRIRYGVGAGYSFGKRIDGSGTNGVVLGLLAGYQITEGRSPLTLDLRYNFVAGSSNELDGYSLTVGGRF